MFSRDYANAQQVRAVKTLRQAETAAEALILPSPPSPKTPGRRRELSWALLLLALFAPDSFFFFL